MVLSVAIAVEGSTDEIVIRRILRYVGLECERVDGRRGKAHLVAKLPAYNAAARYGKTPWLVVLDLDHDAPCAPEYVERVLPSRTERLLLRIAVREVEAWLMADREHLAIYLGIAVQNIPLEPDQVTGAKEKLLDLARRSNRTRLREDMVPRPGSGAKVGPGYTGRIQEFVELSPRRWRPEVAEQHSDSLGRCIRALRQLAEKED